VKKNLPLILILLLATIFRLYQLDQYPAGLNADEAAIGYNAYSLIETGKDEHGTRWPLVFQSFNDFKPPLYFYLVIPFVKFLGLTTLAVRLPSAILGITTVYLIYLLARDLFSNRKIGLLAALMLAIMPWHIHFSRGGWEANVATFFLALSIWLFYKSLKKPSLFCLSALSLSLSLYTYHSIRLIAPLLFFSTLLIYRREIFSIYQKNRSRIIIPIIFFLLTILPLVKQMLSQEGQARFGGVSIFADQGPLWQALEYRRNHDNPDSLMVKAIHNRYLSYSIRFMQNYLSHFSPKFLFVSGDEIARNKVPEMGQSYAILFPFLIFGIYRLCQIKTKESILILFWLMISPLAAAITFQSPHALRAQNMSLPLAITLALGIYASFGYLYAKKSIIFYSAVILFCGLLFYGFSRYLHLYYVHYPKELPFAWEYGYDQVAKFVKENQGRYDKIIISDNYDQPYIIMAFYLKYPPAQLQKEIKLTPRDQYGFSTVRNFGKFEFRQINYSQDKNSPNTLIIANRETVPSEKVIFTVSSPFGDPIFKFIDTNSNQ
jgi:4-amino-4-deoxy-L-arabinose transferase-like glycosyltransferase